MSKIAIIGGSGFTLLKNLVITHSTKVNTPYGEPSAPLSYGMLGEHEVVYLPRRGSEIPMPPHQINYRANIWALRDAGVKTIIATATVATISDDFALGEIVIPDQLIDYTYGRENTFLGEDMAVHHRSFAEPYSARLRQQIIEKAKKIQFDLKTRATYGVVQGPRLETLAEATKLARDGCQLFSMTGMPEATLASELSLDYACIALVVRRAGMDLPGHDRSPEIAAGDKRLEELVEAIILDYF